MGYIFIKLRWEKANGSLGCRDTSVENHWGREII